MHNTSHFFLKLEFVATKTGGFKSDVAIDDISITFDSDCSSDGKCIQR